MDIFQKLIPQLIIIHNGDGDSNRAIHLWFCLRMSPELLRYVFQLMNLIGMILNKFATIYKLFMIFKWVLGVILGVELFKNF